MKEKICKPAHLLVQQLQPPVRQNNLFSSFPHKSSTNVKIIEIALHFDRIVRASKDM